MSEITQLRGDVDMIVLTKQSAGSVAKQIASSFAENKIFVVNDAFNEWHKIDKKFHRFVFRYSELTYNILNHVMVPKHTKVHNKELENIKDQLPVLISYDPVVRRMNYKPGDIIDVGGGYYKVVF